MAPLSLKIVLDQGAVTRTILFDSTNTVSQAHHMIREKLPTGGDGKDYGLFLTSADNPNSGIWLEGYRPLEYYMLRDGDSLEYLSRSRNLRVRMLDGAVKTLQVDETKIIGDLMMIICEKIGLANHDEYGLCTEEVKTEEVKEKPVTGTLTLTLKRKAQRERDAKMEELSKKLKTDDNVTWLDHHKTLREMGVEQNETLLLKRRLFYSDRNVDSRDPVQLNLLYVQTRDAILEGRHPVIENQAVEFAAIQCQIHYGDFIEEKHKPGLIENLNEYLPVAYSNSRGVEKKILKLYRKHHGLSQVEAKYLYIKTARSLPTYGVTFFLVKEKQKDKKKLVPRLLGINCESVLRLDEVTKEVLQVWPLTQVMTYHVGHNDTFTLNFGDYSDKEYSVKTNDAHRIRDILEGYIDIIRKRMLKPHNVEMADGGGILHESVNVSKGNIITHVTHQPSKGVEQTFVGPSRIIEYEAGKQASQGAHTMTVNQVITTSKGATSQHAVPVEVPMRHDLSQRYVKKLNRMNSNSVKIVTWMASGEEQAVKEARRVIEEMMNDLPEIERGVQENMSKQDCSDIQNQLEKELSDLREYLNSLSAAADSDKMSPEEVEEYAKKIANLTAQMCFLLDPKTKRRSELVRKSRQSFIADEKMDRKLRKASLIAASSAAAGNIETAKRIIAKSYNGPPLSKDQVKESERSAVDKLARLNAAVALYLNAHKDPKNIDYASAINSVNTINELIPELINEANAVSSLNDSVNRDELLCEISGLCDAASIICSTLDIEDPLAKEKLQGAAAGFSDSSGKLIYIFGRRNKKVNAEKENEIVDLSKDVGDSTTQLLIKINELTTMIPDPDAAAVEDAGVATADDARQLLNTAQLTAPSIFDPHCQSALTVSIENLSSSLHKLTDTWEPLVLVQDRRKIGSDLKAANTDVEKALDRLRKALSELNDHDHSEDLEQGGDIANSQKLKFIKSLTAVKDRLKNASEDLDKPLPNVQLNDKEIQSLEEGISDKIAEVNSVVASLLNSRFDTHADRNAAEAALNRILELMPYIINDTKSLSSTCKDCDVRESMISDIRQWVVAAGACASLPGPDHRELETCAVKFGKVSQKLSFVFSPRANRAKERLLLELSSLAQERALKMAESGHSIAADVIGPSSAELTQRAAKVEDKARGLRTSVLITSPTIHDRRCQSLILSSVDNLSDSAASLISSAQNLQDNETGCSVLEAKINGQRENMLMGKEMLEAELDGIRGLCGNVQDPQGQKLKFTRSAASIQHQVAAAQDLLQKPVKPVTLTDQQQQSLQCKVTDDIARVNVAVANLLNSDKDDQDSQYRVAKEALRVISELLPSIVNDSRTLVTVCSHDDQKKTLDQLAKWCEDISKICSAAERNDVQELEFTAQKFATTSNKLSFVFNPRKNSDKEQQVLKLTQTASEKAKQMLQETSRVAEAIGGSYEDILRSYAENLASDTRQLCVTAQLTAPSLHDKRSRSALQSSAASVTSSGRQLALRSSLMPHSDGCALTEDLKRHYHILDRAVQGITNICNSDIKPQIKPPVPTRTTPTKPPNDGPATTHTVAKPVTSDSDHKRITNDFLHQLRCDETQYKNLSPSQSNEKVESKVTKISKPEVKAKDEKKIQEHKLKEQEVAAKKAEELRIKEERRIFAEKQEKERELERQAEEEKIRAVKKAEEEKKKQIQEFSKLLKESDKSFDDAEVALRKVYDTTPSPVLNESQIEETKKSMEEKLALAGAAAADIISSNKPETVDYKTSSAAIRKLSSLMPQITNDAILLASSSTEKSRRTLLDEILALCEATKRLCHTANEDRAKLSVAAVDFGDKSARLLYMISTDVDPGQEKDVISIAKSIGDSASRLSLQGASLSSSLARTLTAALCERGRNCAHAAGTMLYTAKLVAPSIHHESSQEALISSCSDLSSTLSEFQSTWQPLTSHPDHSKTVAGMADEADRLEKLLEGFRQDLSNGKLVKKKPVETIVVENTGLRQLAMSILEDAKNRAESVHMNEDRRKCYAAYANRLAEAIRTMDLANHKYRKAPNDIKNISNLENAVENVQVTLLQSRHELDNTPQNNIVDLTDYIRVVTNNAEELTKQANVVAVKNGKPAVEAIKESCHKINLEAFRLVHPTSCQEDKDSVDEMIEVDQFGDDCDKRIQDISSLIQGLEEKDVKELLQEKNIPLIESCNLLRFASKSALSSAKSAALDETFNDLIDLEKRLDTIILPVDGAATNKTKSSSFPTSRARLITCIASLPRGNSEFLTPALSAYITEQRNVVDLHDNAQRNRLKEHLLKVIDLLKMLTNTSRAKHMTWNTDSAEEILYSELVIQELDNPSNGLNVESGVPKSSSVNEAQVNRLLMPVDGVNIEGTPKQKEDKLQQAAMKLTSVTGMIVLSGGRPESLSRSAPAAAAAAAQLAGLANGIHQQEPIRHKKVEEASQEMCFATYNLIKTSELVSQNPNNSNLRKKLLDACRALNDAINKLVRTASTSNKLQRDCSEMCRTIQTQQNLLQSGHPSSAMPYSGCLEAMLSQQEAIQKLTPDEAMSREEFSASLGYVTDAVCNSAQYASQGAYLVSISEAHKEAAKEGIPDVWRIQKLAALARETSFKVLRCTQIEQAKDEESKLSHQIEELKAAVKESATRSKGEVKKELTECGFRIDAAAKTLNNQLHEKNPCMTKIGTSAMTLLDCLGVLNSVIDRSTLVPKAENVSAETKAMVDEVLEGSKTLLSKTQALVKEVNTSDDDPMTWVTYSNGRNGVLQALEALVNRMRNNGRRMGLVEPSKEDEEQDIEGPKKSYIQTQVDVARKWLHRKPSRQEVQIDGVKSVENIIEIASQLSEDLKGQQKEEIDQLIAEMRQLIAECSNKYDNDIANALMERVREIQKEIERIVVARVVEDFLEADAPMGDFEIFLDAEGVESKRNLLLERKIAELMSQLGRVRRTARVVCDTSGDSAELQKCTQQMELLAPLLVKAAQERVSKPHDSSVVDNYKALLAQYTEAMSRVRALCDTSVDPMEFVQTAGENMLRMREESTEHNDPQKCAYTSNVIRRLANRVIDVGISSTHAQDDPELKKALTDAQQKLMQSVPGPNTRPSKMPDWKDVTAELLRATGEVESVLGGENIFKKQPEPDQPIYNAALDLHSVVSEWSARDNDIVSAAKRMAVNMARLANYMHTDKQRELIATSKLTVSEAHEVARLARKLAMECSDIRIRTNLLQVCERILTISGQLKMLTTVKGSSLGRQGFEEDKEAMNMLVGNAQNLMLSVQEVVKAAASASVKIASQRGIRLRWVRKNYY